MNIVRNFYTFTKQLLVGSSCLVCHQENCNRQGLCDDCMATLLAGGVRSGCITCGAVVVEENQQVCEGCILIPKPWDSLIICHRYDQIIKQLLWQYKFHGDFMAGAILAKVFSKRLKQLIETQVVIRPDILLPVPIHQKRLRQRGFNQTAYFAKMIGREIGAQVNGRMISRVKYVKPQAGLSRAQRLMNVKNAFQVKSANNYQHVAIIEDVVTTGSTVLAMTEALLQTGKVHKVSIWSLAKSISIETISK
jgi:ComF family protein